MVSQLIILGLNNNQFYLVLIFLMFFYIKCCISFSFRFIIFSKCFFYFKASCTLYFKDDTALIKPNIFMIMGNKISNNRDLTQCKLWFSSVFCQSFQYKNVRIISIRVSKDWSDFYGI